MAPTSLLISRRAASSTVVVEAGPTTLAEPKIKRDSGGQTPFLFFIALGLGIVFTNLWVVLGLKYCFRNRRLRAMQEISQQRVNGPPNPGDDLAYYLNPLFSTAGRRRRREKRLLAVDDLNERFPVMKYKVWGAEREKIGLSSEGGISQAAAAMQASRMASAAVSTHRQSVDGQQPMPDETHQDGSVAGEASPANSTPAHAGDDAAGAVSDNHRDGAAGDLSRKDDDPAQPRHSAEISTYNLPALFDEEKSLGIHEEDEHMAGADDHDTGDMCAVCLETLEQNDDVRGLSCAHVYHDDCITRWLTTRRACCPLCKNDFLDNSNEHNDDDNDNTNNQGQYATINAPPSAHVATQQRTSYSENRYVAAMEFLDANVQRARARARDMMHLGGPPRTGV